MNFRVQTPFSLLHVCSLSDLDGPHFILNLKVTRIYRSTVRFYQARDQDLASTMPIGTLDMMQYLAAISILTSDVATARARAILRSSYETPTSIAAGIPYGCGNTFYPCNLFSRSSPGGADRSSRPTFKNAQGRSQIQTRSKSLVPDIKRTVR